jgi:hypothetical protein
MHESPSVAECVGTGSKVNIMVCLEERESFLLITQLRVSLCGKPFHIKERIGESEGFSLLISECEHV